MTASTPPSGDEPTAAMTDVDPRLELAHASIDDELSPAEQTAARSDETWRSLVSEATAARDTVRRALAVEPAPEPLRRAHVAAAMAAFDGAAADVPAGPTPLPRSWARALPVGIAAALLAAVVVLGVTRLGDDDRGDTTALADAEDTATEAAGTFDAPAEGGVADDAASQEAAEAPSPAAGAVPRYTVAADPGSLGVFAELVERAGRDAEALAGGAAPAIGPDLAPNCSEDDVLDLLDGIDAADLVLVVSVVDGRSVVGAVDRDQPDQVTIIDLDRCEVVAEP